ncbi:TPA: nucleolar protein family A, member 3-like [Bos taurus]|nr:TPA: nucleolar protein family A, member 3-like [Bos taurus]
MVLGQEAKGGIGVWGKTVERRYYHSGQGDQVYMLKKPDSMAQQTLWAYPAQFSLDDKYSQDEITIKKCFKVLMTQQPRPVL